MPKRKYQGPPRLFTRGLRSVNTALARRLAEVGRAYLRSGAAPAAVSALRGAVAADATRPELRLELARALHAAGRLQAALAWCANLPPEADGRVEALQAEILLDAGRLPQANEVLRRALRRHPHWQGLRIKAAAAFLSAGHSTWAIEVLSGWAGPPRATLLLARAYCLENQPRQALAELKKIPPALRGPEYFELRSRALAADGADQETVQRELREGLARFPAASELRLELAARLLENPVPEDEGHQTVAELLHPLLGGAVDGRLAARAWLLLAKSQRRRPSEIDQAEASLRQALAAQPDDFFASLELGELLLERARIGSALPWLLRALLQQPGHRRAQTAFARALCLTSDDEAVVRWLALLLAAIPQQAADVLAYLVRAAQHAGREEAYQDAYREMHRLKNLLSVAANRMTGAGAPGARQELEKLYQEMVRLLERIRQPCREREPVALSRLLTAVIEESDCQPVELIVRPGLPPVRADAHTLGEALANLVRNARQASADGQPVRVEARLSRDGWLEVAVTDRGPGIPPELQARIFEPGFTTRPGGSGLGLSIARRAIVQHGGSLALFSVPGGPTTFLVRLPPAESLPNGSGLSGRWPGSSP